MDHPTPAAVDAERALLGGILMDGRELVELSRTVRPEDFYRPEHGALFRLLQVMQATGAGTDLVSVCEKLVRSEDNGSRYGGMAYVAELPEHLPSTGSLAYYAERVVCLSQARAMIAATMQAVEELHVADDPSRVASLAAGRLVELAARSQAKRTTWSMTELHQDWQQGQDDVEAGCVPDPLPTGIGQLDKLLTGGGLHPGQLVVVGGQPGMGKTGLALAVATHVAAMGRPVAFQSIEQPQSEIFLRALAVRLEEDTGVLSQQPSDDEPIARASDELGTLYVTHLPGQTMRQVELEVARVVARAGACKLVVIDHLHMVHHEKERDELVSTYVGRSAQQAKEIATKFQVPVMLLAQMNRGINARTAPPKKDRRTDDWWEGVALPIAGDLRDSGTIEAMADVILFPVNAVGCKSVRDPGDEELGAIVIAKQRNGPTGVVPVQWHGKCATYRAWS